MAFCRDSFMDNETPRERRKREHQMRRLIRGLDFYVSWWVRCFAYNMYTIGLVATDMAQERTPEFRRALFALDDVRRKLIIYPGRE